MEAKKNLEVNCAMCDMRNITQKILEAYEKIEINAATITSNQKVNELVANYHVQMNCAKMVAVPDGVELKVINGKYELKGDTAFCKPVFLILNGKVDIMPDAEKSLANIFHMVVNGKLLYPSNLEGKLPSMEVNGKAVCYPADAVRMKADGIIDKIFILRAKAAKYFSERRVMLLDSSLKISSLVEKKTKFITPKAYIATSLLEEGVILFDDDTEICEVPDDCVYVNDDMKLTQAFLAQKGTKLIIGGDVQIDIKDGAKVLDQIEYLCVLGELEIPDTLADKLREDRFVISETRVIKGRVFKNKEKCVIDQQLLAQNGGITVVNCEKVYIEKDITCEDIAERILLHNCETVFCHKEQENMVLLHTENVERVVCEEDDKEDALLQNDDTIIIDTASYTF